MALPRIPISPSTLGPVSPAKCLIGLADWQWVPVGATSHLTVGGLDTSGARPHIDVSPGPCRILAQGCPDVLPLAGVIRDLSGRVFWRYELPGTSAEDANAEPNVARRLQLKISYGLDEECETSVSLRNQLVRPHPPAWEAESQGSENEPKAAEPSESERLSYLVGQHVDLVNELYDDGDATSSWEGTVDGIAYRQLERSASRWMNAGKVSDPRYSLIVRLAGELPDVLDEVCYRPRRVLSRTRQLQPVESVQQLDAACIRWLARQPGRTIAEKAGPRQRVLGLVRFEDFDTLENRVVKDLLVRAEKACTDYLREYRGQHKHERVKLIRTFWSLLRRLRLDSEISTVSGVIGIPQANYALLHDPRYSKLWAAHQALVRQEAALDDGWRWRQRVWSEHMMFAVCAALREIAPQGRWACSDLRLHMAHTAGRFVDPETAFGGWELEFDGGVVYMIDGRHLIESSGVSSNLTTESQKLVTPVISSLCPDLVLVRCDRHRRVINRLGVWSSVIQTPNLGKGPDKLAEELRKAGPGSRGIILLPDYEATEEGGLKVLADPLVIFRYAMPLQKNLPNLVVELKRGIGIL